MMSKYYFFIDDFLALFRLIIFLCKLIMWNESPQNLKKRSHVETEYECLRNITHQEMEIPMRICKFRFSVGAVWMFVILNQKRYSMMRIGGEDARPWTYSVWKMRILWVESKKNAVAICAQVSNQQINFYTDLFNQHGSELKSNEWTWNTMRGLFLGTYWHCSFLQASYHICVRFPSCCINFLGK